MDFVLLCVLFYVLNLYWFVVFFFMFVVIISCDGLNMNEYDCLEVSFLDLKLFCF